MFCIAVFIVFGILAVFSASYRPLAAKAWHCVLRRVTFRPCDISFGEEMKGRLTGKLLFTHPALARFLNRWIDWLSFAFVALSIWSVVYVLNAGLNLWVYDTCDPRSAESCSLSGEACGVEQERLGMVQAVSEGRILEWATGPVTRLGETLSRIPDRLRAWDASDYLAPTATFRHPFDAAKPTVLEVIDPGCRFCKKLTRHLEEAGVMERANVSYLLYPISLPDGDHKFVHSPLMASYIEAAKRVPAPSAPDTPGDWQLLAKIFEEPAGDNEDIQTRFNIGMTRTDAEATLKRFLSEIGYTPADVDRIASLAAAAEVQDSLAEQRRIVEERIRTIKIPTLLLGGRRYDRVVDVETLRSKMETGR